ncbi:hypothetical protein [Siphonobacter curvatus]|nr:hypothetical protein [Siphonobacter curvatus]
MKWRSWPEPWRTYGLLLAWALPLALLVLLLALELFNPANARFADSSLHP